MSLSYNDVGQTVSFSVHAPSIVPGNFTNVLLVGILDPDSANKELTIGGGGGIAQLHAEIYPSLPEGTVDSPTAYNYIKVKLPNQKFAVIGIPWINMSTYQVVAGLGTTYAMLPNTTPDDQVRLRNLLLANNFNIGYLGYNLPTSTGT